jgi:hypothetical protein
MTAVEQMFSGPGRSDRNDDDAGNDANDANDANDGKLEERGDFRDFGAGRESPFRRGIDTPRNTMLFWPTFWPPGQAGLALAARGEG